MEDLHAVARVQVSREARAQCFPSTLFPGPHRPSSAHTRPPRLVFVTDQGKTVRFLSAKNIAPLGDRWAKWIADGDWAAVEPWTSRYKAGGDR